MHLLFVLCLQRPTSSTLFPYTTLFRSAPPWRKNSIAILPCRDRVRGHVRHAAISSRQMSSWSTTSTPSFSALAVLAAPRSEEHTSELQSQSNLVCRLLLEKKKNAQ